MKKNLHPIDEIFLDGLTEKQDQPSLATWDAIEKSLDKNIVNTFKQKYIQLQRIIIVLLLLLAFVSIYTINSYKKNYSNNTVINSPAVANETPISVKISDENSRSNKLKSIEKKASSPLINTSKSEKVDVNASINITKKSLTIVGAKNPKVIHQVAKTNNPIAEADLEIIKPSKPKENPIAAKTIYTSNKNQNSKNPLKETITTVSIERKENTEKHTTKTKVATFVPEVFNKTSIFQMEQIESIKTNRNPNGGIPEINQLPSNASTIPIVKVENTPTSIVEKKTKEKTPIRFSIIPNLSLNTLNTRIVVEEDLGSRREYLRKKIIESEATKLEVSFGIALEINLSKRISIESGINYFEKNTTIKPRTIGAERNREGKIKYRFDCSAGTYYIDPKLGTTLSIGDSTKSFSANNQLQYINTPLIARYQLVKGKINWFQTVGIGANMLVGQSFETSIDNNYTEKLKKLKTKDLKKMYFNGIVGVGIDYNISKRLSIRMAPIYRFSITPMNKNESIKTYPHSFSATAGLKIGL